MARPRSFDPDVALDAAMDLFWEKGYEATSVDDLSAALGVTRPAIYRQWGSKQGVYLQALQRYRMSEPKAFVERLQADPENAAEIIRDRLVEIVRQAEETDRYRGCFVVNAIAERTLSDEATSEQVRQALQALEIRIATALKAASDAGVIGDGDTDAMARYFVVVMMGLRVVGKARPTREALDGVVAQAMSVVVPSSN